MFEGWSEFYVMFGSAAAVLIGLIFVVITFMQGRSRSSVLYGSKLYMGPIVLHMSFVLALSAAALAPGISVHSHALIALVAALWGLARGVYSTLGIRKVSAEVHWTDMWFYGVIPAVFYAALAVVAFAMWRGVAWAPYGIAAVVTALVLLSVRNEWDLVTWLAPRPDEQPSAAAGQQLAEQER